MVKAVTASYIAAESKNVTASFVYKITYQESAGTNITIPASEVMIAPTISDAIGRDFMSASGGDVRMTLDNRDRQWDETYATAYNRAKYDGDLRVEAGFTLSDGTDELVELFSGKITDIKMSGVAPRNAIITARNEMLDKIAKTTLGKPISSGTANPYLYGAISRLRLTNLFTPDPNTWTFQYGGTIQWVSVKPGVLVRDDEISNWHPVSPNSINYGGAGEASKVIRLGNVVAERWRSGQVWFSGVRKFAPGTQLPYLINDILLNYVGIPATHINATSLERMRNLDRPGSWGIDIYNKSAREVIQHISNAQYSVGVVEGKKFTLISLASPISSGIHLSEADYMDWGMTYDKTRIINQVDIPYLTYPHVADRFKRASNLTSQASYGTIPLSAYMNDLSFTNVDPLRVYGATHGDVYQRLANTIITYNAHAKRIFTLSNVYPKALRLEQGDRLRISNDFYGIAEASAVVIGKRVDLKRKRTDMVLLSWP